MGNLCPTSAHDYEAAAAHEGEVLELDAEDLKSAFHIGTVYGARAMAFVLAGSLDLSVLMSSLGSKDLPTEWPGEDTALTLQSITDYLTSNAASIRAGRLDDNSRRSLLPSILVSEEVSAKDSVTQWQVLFKSAALASMKLVGEEREKGSLGSSSMTAFLSAAQALGPISLKAVNIDVVEISSVFSVIAAAVQNDMVKLGVEFTAGGPFGINVSNIVANNEQAALVMAGIGTFTYISGDQNNSAKGAAMSLSAARTSMRKSVRNSQQAGR